MRSTDHIGFFIVEMGLMATRRSIGSPLVIPPVKPPARLVRWRNRPPSYSIWSWKSDPWRAELDALDGVDGKDRLRDAAVELAIPMHVAAQAWWDSPRDDPKGAADRVA